MGRKVAERLSEEITISQMTIPYYLHKVDLASCPCLRVGIGLTSCSPVSRAVERLSPTPFSGSCGKRCRTWLRLVSNMNTLFTRTDPMIEPTCCKALYGVTLFWHILLKVYGKVAPLYSSKDKKDVTQS